MKSIFRKALGCAAITFAATVSAGAWAADPAQQTTGSTAKPSGTQANGASVGADPTQEAIQRYKAQPAKAHKPATKLVDINSASKAQLKKLPGVSDADADRIIANRPYLSKADLVDKKAIPLGSYMTIKNQIIAMQPTTIGPSKSAASKSSTTKSTDKTSTPKK